MGDVPPVEHDRARLDVDDPQECATKRCFAGARFADDADGFATADPEVDAMQDFDAADTLAVQAPLPAIDDLDAARDEKILSHAAA